MKKNILKVIAVIMSAQLLAGCPSELDTQRFGAIDNRSSSPGFEDCVVGEITARLPTVDASGSRATRETSMYAVRCNNSTTTVDYQEGKTRKQVTVSDGRPVKNMEVMVLPREMPNLEIPQPIKPNSENNITLPEKLDKNEATRYDQYFKALEELVKAKDRLAAEREKLGLNKK
jgi:hypothetical protein